LNRLTRNQRNDYNVNKYYGEEIFEYKVKEVFKDSDQKEFYRKNFLELIELLLTEIEK
jgi:hypothetical protein